MGNLLHENIRHVRTVRECPALKAAAALNMTERDYVALEDGERHITANRLARLAVLFGVSVAELATGYITIAGTLDQGRL